MLRIENTTQWGISYKRTDTQFFISLLNYYELIELKHF